MLFSFTFKHDNAASITSKNASHVIGPSTTPWLVSLSALNDRRSSSTADGGIFFLSVFLYVHTLLVSRWLSMAMRGRLCILVVPVSSVRV